MDRQAPIPPEFETAIAAHAHRLGSFGRPFLYFDEVASTNDVASRLAAGGAEEGTTVVAEAQAAGRGRQGRAWFSPPGAGLYVSVVLRPPGPEARQGRRVAALITLAGGAAIAEAVRAATALPVELKWPNDVVIGRPRRKLAGLLAEASTTEGLLTYVVLGIGINLRAVPYPASLGQTATSIELELGRAVETASVFVESLAKLSEYYGELRNGRAAAVLDRWRALAPDSQGSLVEWSSSGGTRRGRTRGIDDDGALLVQVDQTVERVVAGDLRWIESATS